MTPKEKALELINKFEEVSFQADKYNISSALICVDEIISACEYNNVESYNSDWWLKVKTEINNLKL